MSIGGMDVSHMHHVFIDAFLRSESNRQAVDVILHKYLHVILHSIHNVMLHNKYCGKLRWVREFSDRGYGNRD